MTKSANEIVVNLGDRSYSILLRPGKLDLLCGELSDRFPGSRFLIVTNTTLGKLYRAFLSDLCSGLSASTHEIADGERHKNLTTWSSILDSFVEAKLDRTSVAVALGGGVVGDITGFAAAAYLRGIRYVQIPTTLLAMVDSSVGGKCAVNHPSGKNLIGAFHQPSMVWVDSHFLSTLPTREYIAGYAEVFKYAFIGGKEMFEFISRNHEKLINRSAEEELEGIRRSIEIKARVVEEDEKESGIRAHLNFGHTFGHALEQYYHYSGLLHGEAVLWGIACACELGQRTGTMVQGDHASYEAILKKLPRVKLPSRPQPKELYERMALDKKASGGKLRFILPTTPGISTIVEDPPRELVLESMEKVLDSWE